MRDITSWCLVAFGLLLLCGCGGGDAGNLPATVTASGVVLLDGSPVHGASVVFAPEPPGQYPAFGMSDRSGGFDLKAFEAKDGAVPGTYKVQVTKTVEVQGSTPAPKAVLGEDAEHAKDDEEGGLWKNDLPKKYASVATSELTVEIPEGGRTDIKIELVTNP